MGYIKNVIVGGTIAALVGTMGTVGMAASAEAGTKPSVQACATANLNAKAKGWADVLNGRGYGDNKVPSYKVREAQVAADMANAAKNMKSGSYRYCWGE